MANRMYPAAKTALLNGSINFSSADIRVVLVNTTGTGTLYTYNAAHDFLDDVASGSRVGTPVALASKTVGTVAAGVFDAADTTLTAVTGDVCEACILFIHTGTDSTARLLFYFDTGVTGLPVTPSGGDITLGWNASGIFAIND